MTSLCAHHRVLLLHILQEMMTFLPKDECGAVVTQRDVHGTAVTPRSERSGGYCCRTDRSVCVLSSCVAARCVCPCRLGVCALHSTCLCMNRCSSLSCQNVTFGCASCCTCSRLLVCQHKHSSNNTHIAHTGSVTNSRCLSPSPPPLSPPPLSPKPQDGESSHDPDMPTLNTHTLNTQPPPLLPHNTHTNQTLIPETHAKPEHFIDLMDKFTDTLMEVSEREWSVHTHMGDGVKACDDTHLTEIITTVLHSSSEKDYNLKELFEQHLASEKRSPQTRSQRRQEVMQAISRAHDQPATRRQSLQIKRDLARLEPDISRKKKRKTHLITHGTHTQSPDTPISQAQSPDTPISQAQSPDTPISQAQGPDTPISQAQGPDTPISQAQGPDTPTSQAQGPDTPTSQAQGPDTPTSQAQGLDMPTSQSQNPDTSTSQAPSTDMPKSLSQSPDPTNSHTQNPDTPISHAQRPDTPVLQAQSPDMPVSHARSPDTTNTHARSPDTTNTHARSPDTTNTQSPDTTNSHPQRQDTSNTHSNISEPCREKSEPCGTVRSRRNIVRPQHLSSYVTEPRKMFYAACRSAKTNSTPIRSTDMTEPPCSTVTEQLKTPPGSPIKRKIFKDENSGQSQSERRLKTCHSEDKAQPPSPVIIDSTDIDDVKYVSPIKLMLVSTIKDEDGVKYTLRAAQPNNDEESFDPCVEASWMRNTNKEQTENKTIQLMNNECAEKLCTEESANIEGLSDCVKNINETEQTIKRRPGRPKKLKAPMEKAVKRPIGRPRKSKLVDTNVVSSEETEKQSTEDASSGEDCNKNLKITITYGRRKARRRVCEGQVPSEQSKGSRALTQSSNAEENAQSIQAQVSMNKDQLSLVIPVEDRKNLTHSIMCPKQSDGAGTRRPGRPAKVKISGISVTVTTVSPRQRKIHMKRDVREPAIQGRALVTELEPNEEQETITEETQASVRHSVRERRPSIHLLRCIAVSRSNTPTPRSRKPLVNKANETQTQQETQQHEPKDANDTKAGPNTSPQDTVHFSAASVESLFDANLQWWPTSASPEALKKEMNRRLKVMTETWVSDTPDVATLVEDNSSGSSSSAVRMLFEQDCSMETLCSWFMQTTETQSLAIVKKANNRSPCEVFQYSSVQASNRPNICSSPQAERLRKCVKKFATVVPKSLMKLRRAQAKIRGGHNSFTKQHIFHTAHNDIEKSQQCGAWHLYRAALDRARSRFKSRTKNIDYKSLNEQEESGTQPVSVSEQGLLNTVQSESRRTSTQQEQITANAWSAHTLRECKVFLRKLNSANTRSLSEESNDCTVRFSVSPAGGGSVQHHEQGVRKSIKLEKMNNSGTSTWQQSKVNRKRRHSCTNVLPPSRKQQRSSRGVMAAKWSDFILGPAR